MMLFDKIVILVHNKNMERERGGGGRYYLARDKGFRSASSFNMIDATDRSHLQQKENITLFPSKDKIQIFDSFRQEKWQQSLKLNYYNRRNQHYIFIRSSKNPAVLLSKYTSSHNCQSWKGTNSTSFHLPVQCLYSD